MSHTGELRAVVMNVRVKTRRINSFEMSSERETVAKDGEVGGFVFSRR